MGKAFEYACAVSISGNTDNFELERNSPYETAERCFAYLDALKKVEYEKGANAAIKIINRLEPMLIEGPGVLNVKLNSDAADQAGDVRDVICSRGEWEIGLSCKHNHEAVKHSRLSGTIDFGEKWFGIPCSQKYFSAIIPLFDQLRAIQQESNKAAKWDIVDKEHDYYIPVLNAFVEEIKNLDRDNPKTIPARLIRYLIGVNDFYKVIMNEQKRFTKIESININGTLNKPAGRKHGLIDVPLMQLPTKFYDIDFEEREGMVNTIHVVCDQGCNVSMRIHNASSRIEPSLKFDVQLQAMPNSILTQIEPWE